MQRKWLARSVQGRRSFSFALLCVHQRAGAALMKKRERKKKPPDMGRRAAWPSQNIKKHAFARRAFFFGGACGAMRTGVGVFSSRLGRGAAKEKKAAGGCCLCRRRGAGEEEENEKTYYATATTTRTVARQLRPTAAAIPQPPPSLVTALHLAAPPPPPRATPPEVAALLGRPPVAITATAPIAVVTAHRVTSRRVLCACGMMTT